MNDPIERDLSSAAAAVQRAERDAEPKLRELCARYPLEPRTHFFLGAWLERAGRYYDALEAFDRVLRLQPRHVQAASARALSLNALGRTEEAHRDLEAEILHQPDSAQLWTNLGVLREQFQDFEGALAAYDRALALQCAPVGARMNRGNVLVRMRRLQEACENNRLFVGEHPEDPVAHFNLGDVLLALDDPEETLRECAVALDLAPGYSKARLLSGIALSQLGRFDEADRLFSEVRRDDPQAMARFGNFLAEDGSSPESPGERFDPEVIFLYRDYGRLHRCDWSRYALFIREFEDVVSHHLAADLPIADHSVAYHALTLPFSGTFRTQIARTMSCRLARLESATRSAPPMPPRSRAGRLRIAYVSPDCREHLNAYLLRPIVQLHDRSRFEVTVFSTGPVDGSAVRHRIQQAAEGFVDVAGLARDEIVTRIREAGIDLLVDVGGFTGFSRPDVLALQPAPVQVGYLAFPGSLGMDAVQYRITDRTATPAGQESVWSEKLVYLPDTFFIYDRDEPLPALSLTLAEYGLSSRDFVFCSFNNYYKIEPGIFGIWMEILKAVPASVLWLAGRDPAALENLRREAKARGVNAERLVFAPFESRDRYRARFKLADLFLDTPIFNAMTTACDALAAGLPLLTVAGEHFPSRVAASILGAAGFSEGVVDSIDAYRDRAITWGNDPDALRQLRQRRLSDPLSLPLFDSEARVRQLEAAYLEMWRRFEQGLDPESFDVAAKPPPPTRNRWH